MVVVRRAAAKTLGEVAAALAVVAALSALVAISRAPEPESAGPVLIDALATGWRPDAAPKNAGAPHPKRCAGMCGAARCCERCRDKDMCCCAHFDKCPCVKDPTRGDGR